MKNNTKSFSFGRSLGIFILYFLSALDVSAYDFEVNGIYYNILSSKDKTVEVKGAISTYSGYVSLSPSVTYNGNTYSVKSIGEGAFYNDDITKIIIPNSVTSIGGSAFQDCSGLTSITIPNSVTSIASFTFYGCSGLTSVTIPNSVKSIGSAAFYGCSALTSVTIPNSVTSIGYNAFTGCSGLTSITIPNSVSSIENYAFAGCSGLTSATIPNSVTSIGISAFERCSSLTSLTIPNSVISIGQYAFRGCSGLTSVVWNVKKYGNFSSSNYPFPATVKTVTFGDEVENIPAYMCYNMTGLTSVTISNSVTSIGNNAFTGCSGLTSVAWNAKKCGDFSSSNPPFPTTVKTVTFGDGVEKIPAYMCYKMRGLTSVTIPNSVTSIGSGAFDWCYGLTKAEFSSIESLCKINFGDYYANPLYNAEHLYINGKEVKDLIIPDNVTSIGSYAFYRCSGLTSVTIHSGVKSIGSYAFSSCHSLTSVTIPNSVKSIGSYAFSYCM